MAVTTYETLEGEILGETRGGTERDYVPDPLGSTAALIDSAQAKTDSFAYWPYGEERSHTGTTATPFRFVGAYGYYRDDSGRTYVRARQLLTKNARWQTVDPSWPDESAYGYADYRPTAQNDPQGTTPGQVHRSPPPGGDSCIPADNCIRIGGCHCSDQGPDCKVTGTVEYSCCVDFDHDRVYHWIVVKFEKCVCEFKDCNVPGKTSEFEVPTGEWRYLRNKHGQLRTCVKP